MGNGEGRGGRPLHQPYSGQHVHSHPAFGHPGGDPVYGMPPGHHMHAHSHSRDASHDHHHEPGQPGPGMPEVMLHDADPGGEVSGIGLGEQIRRYLEGQGVNVEHALADLEHAGERQAQRARDRVQRAGDIAFQLRKAKRKLWFEQQGFATSSPGFTIAKISEAQERVSRLDAELREVCVNDPELISEAKRKAGR